MEYKVTIDKFEGPLDLLLHLIKQTDIDIFEINISEITTQYLNYIKAMENLNLDVASEYLTMATELNYIKSKELLPATEEEEESLKENLINRLVEYQRYKEVSKKLKDLALKRNELYTKSPTLLSEFKSKEIEIDEDITLETIIDAFAKLNEKIELEKPLNTVIAKKEYSVAVRNKEILQKLNVAKKIEFEQLFEIYNKSYVIVTFLSILDLAKKKKIKIKQEKTLEKIYLLKEDE